MSDNKVSDAACTPAPPEVQGLPPELIAERAADGDAASQDIRAKIAGMLLPERMRLAMLGNATCRTLLIADGNKGVQMAVLGNPRLQLNEVETFAKNKNLSDVVLRAIADNKDWSKHYGIRLSLVNNPKTPQDISIKWISYLRDSDKKNLAKSKNIPQAVALAAKRALAAK
jgi:hypothetical protein